MPGFHYLRSLKHIEPCRRHPLYTLENPGPRQKQPAPSHFATCPCKSGHLFEDEEALQGAQASVQRHSELPFLSSDAASQEELLGFKG